MKPLPPLVLLAFGLLALSPTRAELPFSLKSPDGKLTFHLTNDGRLRYAVDIDGQPLVESSALGIRVNGVDLGVAAAPTGTAKRRLLTETFATRGGHDRATSEARTALLPFSSGEKKIAWQLEIRVANDGAAFRYLIPSSSVRRIEGESTEWTLPAGSTTLWFQGAENRSYEDRYRPERVDGIKAGRQIMVPATAKLPGGLGYAVLTEANVVGYSDMALESTESRKFRALFHDDPQGWDTRGDVASPWRVTLYSPSLNGLVNSDFIESLCPPPPAELAVAPWIRPGRSIWHWLTGGAPKLEEQKSWIDGTSAMGYEYYLIDDGWKGWKGGGEAAWKALEEMVRYAKSRDVATWVWVHSDEVFRPNDRADYFRRMKKLGVAGLKIDFPKPASAEWVQWYDDTLRDAADAKLMIDFHGSTKPSGRARTWPHEMTREAICGREQGKLPAEHDTALPFVRYVQGHADYTPVLLAADRLNGSSHAHEIAMAVVFTSPFLCFGDRPQAYLEHPAADVLKALPATWNETRVLPGSEIGEMAAFARRHGREWFVGVVNGAAGRPGSIALDFLGDGDYELVAIADDPARNDAVVRTERIVKRADTIEFPLRGDGGFVAWLRPAKR